MKQNRIIIFGIAALVVLIIAGVFVYRGVFGAPQKQAELERFTIAIGKDDSSEITKQLKAQGFIKSELGFRVAFFGLKGLTDVRCVDCVSAGAYKISKAMNAWEIAKILRQEPYMKWVVIPEGLRKEQIAELIGDSLGWDQEAKRKWIGNYTAMNYDEIEGVYFPDTYLLPKDETGLQIADRLRAKFNEKFAPYADKFLEANIKWTTALKLASIVQREAAGKDDMPLIAGILWNRLLKDMKLEVDATIQYVRGDVGNGWWAFVTLADKNIDSPYNTYKYKGLPPHPIANPGLDAIRAVLEPTETECLFYLHDANKQIHCAKTYEEHQKNISTYLK